MHHALVHRLLPLLLCTGLLVALRWSGLGVAGVGPESTTVAVGFLLIGAFIAGKASAGIGLPRITGYLIIGAIAGPYATALLTKDMLSAGRVVEGIAVSLIALAAGGELRLSWLRAEARKLLVLTFSALISVWTGVMALLLIGRSLFPFMPEDPALAVVVAFVFGAIAVSLSPTVTLAVIAETRAEGPLARTVLGVTILADLVVIVLFATALSVARSVFGDGGGSLGIQLARELGGSIALGLAVGIGIILYLRKVGRDVAVFVLGVCFAIAEVSLAFHLEALLVALTAGFVVENFSRSLGHRLIEGIERLSLPVFALFFAAAGAKVDLQALTTMGPLALLVVVVRATCLYGGTRLGARLLRVEPVVARYTWVGLLSQAGVSLALAATVARAFPEWGDSIQVVILAMIAVHEVVGPIGFQRALTKAGETR